MGYEIAVTQPIENELLKVANHQIRSFYLSSNISCKSQQQLLIQFHKQSMGPLL